MHKKAIPALRGILEAEMLGGRISRSANNKPIVIQLSQLSCPGVERRK